MSNKFFSVQRTSSGQRTFAKAPSAALALVAVTKSEADARPFAAVKPATDEQVFDHTAVHNKTLHPKSRERADGLRLFVVPRSAEPEAELDLVRARNAEDAFVLVTGDDYEVSQLDQEELLALVGENPAVVEYSPPPKRKRTKKAVAAADGADNAAPADTASGVGTTRPPTDPDQRDAADSASEQPALV